MEDITALLPHSKKEPKVDVAHVQLAPPRQWYRHLMEDITTLLPHSKKEPKVDVARGRQLNEALSELMDLRGCSLCLFFEMRKQRDLYLWLSKGPSGPSVKFLVSAVHTMEELKLTGNHLKGSRPFLTFSPSFDRLPFLSVLKELFIQTFATPKGHRKSKPFYDHVLTFTYLDGRIWFRNYQICIPGAEGAARIDDIAMEKMSLVEVGAAHTGVVRCGTVWCAVVQCVWYALHTHALMWSQPHSRAEGVARIDDVTMEKMSLVEVGAVTYGCGVVWSGRVMWCGVVWCGTVPSLWVPGSPV
ncbi:unnamed protein product [Closterium sp. NIES-54]